MARDYSSVRWDVVADRFLEWEEDKLPDESTPALIHWRDHVYIGSTREVENDIVRLSRANHRLPSDRLVEALRVKHLQKYGKLDDLIVADHENLPPEHCYMRLQSDHLLLPVDKK